jgi:hypothetical protein
MDVLMLGCGRERQRRIVVNGKVDFADDRLTCIDITPAVHPDVVFDLDVLHSGGKLCFSDDSFDEIHAYDVLEHVGRQGDWKGFFAEFAEYHRVLKQNGLMFVMVPVGVEAFCDPGQTLENDYVLLDLRV